MHCCSDTDEYGNRVYSKTIILNGQLHQKCHQYTHTEHQHCQESGRRNTPENNAHHEKSPAAMLVDDHCNDSDNDEIHLYTKNGIGPSHYSNVYKKSSFSYNGVHGTSSGIRVGGAYLPTNLLQILCLVVLAVLCYYNSTQCGLVFDDISAIRDNRDLRPYTPIKQIFLNDFWGTPMRKEQSHKSYRPFTVLTFRFNYWLHELQPYGYHVINVILHIVVSLLWRRVSRLLMRQCTLTEQFADECSFLSAVLFVVHPIHTEAVTGVVGRAELLSSIFFLGAFLCYNNSVQGGGGSSMHRNNNRRCSPLTGFSAFRTTRWLNLIIGFSGCLMASMLCKEQGITVAGICVAYEIFVVQNIHPMQLWYSLISVFESNDDYSNASNQVSPIKKGNSRSNSKTTFWTPSLMKRLGFLCTVVILLLVGRVYVMGSQLPIFTRFDNPASVAPSPQRQLTYAYLIFLNIWLLLFPCDLCCDWTMGTVPLIEGFHDVRNLLTVITLVTLLMLVVCASTSSNSQHSKTLLMCMVWMILPFLPASNLFFPVGFVVAERILYMPSMGFSLLMAYGYKILQFRRSKNSVVSTILKITLLTLILTHALRTVERNKDWRNEYTLFMSGIRVNERNAKLFNNVGHALENEGRYQEALVYFKRAVFIQPDDIGAHINVGRTYNNLELFDKAEMAYLKAKSLFPRVKPGESYQARIAPNHLNVFINLANLIARNRTRLEEADHLYRQAISMRADYVQAYINRGDILMKLNRTAQAQEVYEKALLYDNENADIYYNLGVVCLEQGKNSQAHVYFNKALQLHPAHEQALLNSAILLQEAGSSEARQLSRERLHKILQKNGSNEKVFFNLGMLEMDEGNFEAAEQYFKRAIHLKADFRSALFNLALLLADTKRPLDAIPFLNQLIRHHRYHIKGLILLGDIYINHMKDLDAAEECYRSIVQYEKHNVQGRHNLCVVYVERKHLMKADVCLRNVHQLAPNEDYISRHLKIVETRLQKIAKLPDNTPDKKLAFTAFTPEEFALVSLVAPTSDNSGT